MKKKLLLINALFFMLSLTSYGQTLTPDSVPAVQVGTTVNISFSYTSNVTCAVYAELRIANIDENNVITQDYSNGSNYIVGSFSEVLSISSTPAVGSLSITVPSNAVPSANLPSGKTYSWVYKLTPGVNDYNEVGTTFQYTSATILASNNAVDSLTLITPPTEITAGTDVSITVNYTCPAPRLIKFGISIYNANGFVADLVGTGVDNLAATTTTPVSLTQILTIPANATPSSELPSGQFYKVDTALFTPGFANYIMGTSTNVTLNPQLNNADFNKPSITIYPNPARNLISFNTNEDVSNYQIFNVIGKLVMGSEKLNSTTIDISNLESGIYFVKFGNQNPIKFIKL